ncbi:MAG: hypothetical protein NTY53_18470, partial [Kiritimatiellaeota bacterium]|nr:hypothetical protein [Kiritimatiellota bacterium]
LARVAEEQVGGIYWSIIVLAAIPVCLLLVLPAITPSGMLEEGSGAVPGGTGATAATSFVEKNQVLSLVILFAVIMIVQGACLWIARRKLRDVEEDAGDPALKLRRLENLDIFFDLPLYCGLALTIFAFILISTFGAGVSRFLAYSSTFIGIIFAVILRVGHLYPLREKLINQKG